MRRHATLTTFQPPGATNNSGPIGQGTFAEGINNFGIVGGLYTDANSQNHGYLRKPNGSFVIIDVPGATGTVVQDISDLGWIVGRYIDGGGRVHGYVEICGTFVTFDVTGAIQTSLTVLMTSGSSLAGTPTL